MEDRVRTAARVAGVVQGVGFRPLVATSGNVSDEPIAFQDTDARQRLGPIADAFLVHDRAIHIRTDDSVVRAAGGREVVLRRSRGYAPEPVSLAVGMPRPVLDARGPLRVRGADLVRAAAVDVAAGAGSAAVAARPHRGIGAAVIEVCRRLRNATGLQVVALSGGVFQNVLLSELTLAGLERCGFRVLQHSRVPCNDGGISLGRAAIAGARDRAAPGSPT